MGRGQDQTPTTAQFAIGMRHGRRGANHARAMRTRSAVTSLETRLTALGALTPKDATKALEALLADIETAKRDVGELGPGKALGELHMTAVGTFAREFEREFAPMRDEDLGSGMFAPLDDLLGRMRTADGAFVTPAGLGDGLKALTDTAVATRRAASLMADAETATAEIAEGNSFERGYGTTRAALLNMMCEELAEPDLSPLHVTQLRAATETLDDAFGSHALTDLEEDWNGDQWSHADDFAEFEENLDEFREYGLSVKHAPRLDAIETALGRRRGELAIASVEAELGDELGGWSPTYGYDGAHSQLAACESAYVITDDQAARFAELHQELNDKHEALHARYVAEQTKINAEQAAATAKDLARRQARNAELTGVEASIAEHRYGDGQWETEDGATINISYDDGWSEDPRDGAEFGVLCVHAERYSVGTPVEQELARELANMEDADERVAYLRDEHDAAVILAANFTAHSSNETSLTTSTSFDTGALSSTGRDQADFAFVTRAQLVESYGSVTPETYARAEVVLADEVAEYNGWRTGRTYRWEIETPDGEHAYGEKLCLDDLAPLVDDVLDTLADIRA